MSFVPQALILTGLIGLMFSLEIADAKKDITNQMYTGRAKITVTGNNENENDKENWIATLVDIVIDGDFWIKKCTPKIEKSIRLAVDECRGAQTIASKSEEKDKVAQLELKSKKGDAENSGNPAANSAMLNILQTTIAIIILVRLVLLRGQLSI